jgi:hypothetical protein
MLPETVNEANKLTAGPIPFSTKPPSRALKTAKLISNQRLGSLQLTWGNISGLCQGPRTISKRLGVGLRLTYTFPPWLLMMALSGECRAEALPRLSVQWCLSMTAIVKWDHPIMVYVRAGNQSSVIELLRQGQSRVNDHTLQGFTPLHVRTIHSSSN